jgi:hydrogenase nickel incorporation protein HypA/HybF
MHELAVCQALIGQIERVARNHHASRVLSVTLAIGPLAGVEPKLLEHAYPLAAAGTVAQDARLVIEAVPVRVRCRKCRAETAVATNRLLCGACNDWQVDVIAGEEMLLQRVEIEPAGEPVDRAGRRDTQENRTDVS